MSGNSKPNLFHTKSLRPGRARWRCLSAPGRHSPPLFHRYVYHPLEQLYLVLITTKSSNIVEDLDTIRMLSKLVPEQLGMDAPSEASILAHAFELVFALDEAITADGHKELGDLDDIRTNLAMDSHEEKLANLVKESKQAQAKTEATRREEEMRRKRAEEAKAVADGAPPKPASSGGRYGGVSSGSYGGVSSASMGGRGSGGGSRTPLGSSSGGVSSSSYGGVSSASAAAKRAEGSSGTSTQQPSKPRGVGMKLGGGGGKGAGATGAKAGGMRLGGAGSHLASMMAEEGLSMADMAGASAPSGGSAEAAVSAAAAAAAAASADQASASVQENMNVTLTRDGEASMQVRGSLSLTAHSAEAAGVAVQLARGPAAAGFAFQNNPNTEKQAFTDSAMIALKDTKSYPVGTTVGVLRWRKATKVPEEVPLTLNVWPEPQGDGTTALNIEYTLQLEHMVLDNVMITVPLPAGGAGLTINSADGDAAVAGGALVWSIDSISSANASGTLDVIVPGDDEDGFFPVGVAFASTTPVCGLTVSSISVPGGEAVRSSTKYAVVPDSYEVQGFV